MLFDLKDPFAGHNPSTAFKSIFILLVLLFGYSLVIGFILHSLQLVHPGLSQQPILDILWSFSHYVEAIAIYPQLLLFSRSRVEFHFVSELQKGEIESFTSHFVFSLAVSRLLALLFWCSCWRELNSNTNALGSVLAGRSILLSQFIQIVLMGRYVYYYLHALFLVVGSESQMSDWNSISFTYLSKQQRRIDCLFHYLLYHLFPCKQ